MIVGYDDLKTYGEFTSDLETDFDLQLQSAQEIVENYLGYPIEEGTITRTVDGSGSSTINLGCPVKEITSVTIDEELTPLSEFYISGEYLFRKGNYFPEGEQNTIIVFVGGYEDAKIPAIMKLTVLRIAAVLISEGAGSIGVSSVSDPNTGSRTFMERTFKRYLKELDPYRVSQW
jgi:hypothetical protein